MKSYAKLPRILLILPTVIFERQKSKINKTMWTTCRLKTTALGTTPVYPSMMVLLTQTTQPSICERENSVEDCTGLFLDVVGKHSDAGEKLVSSRVSTDFIIGRLGKHRIFVEATPSPA